MTRGSKEPARLDLVEYFGRIAADVGAERVWPLPDGALHFRYASADPSYIVWTPRPAEGGLSTLPMGGSFFAARPRTNLRPRLEAIARALRHVEERSEHGICPLHTELAPEGELVIDGEFVERHLSHFLRSGLTAWGAFLFVGVSEEGAQGVELAFRSPTRELALRIRPLPANATAPVSVGPLQIELVDDTRSAEERERPEGRPEDYVLYALQRSVVDGQTAAARRIQRPPPGRPAADAQEEGLAFDPRDESAHDGFFIDRGDRSIGHFEMFTTLLDADDAISFATYSRPECSHKLPFLRTARYAGSMWHRFITLPWSIPRKPVEFIAPSETEIILGSEPILRDGVGRMAAEESLKMLVVNASCLCDYPGVDLEGVAREAGEARGVPLVMTRSAVEQGSPVEDFWKELFQLVDRSAAPQPGVVNLVGYAAEDRVVGRELRAMVTHLGLRVNGLIVPSFRTGAVERFLTACHTVQNTDLLVDQEFRGVRERFPDMPVTCVAPPFGPGMTKRFLARVAHLAGAAAEPARIDELWAPHAETWDRWRRRAGEHEVALVVRAVDAPLLTEPEELYGLDIVTTLLEMGFAVRIVCLPQEGGTPKDASRWTSARLRQHYEDALREDAETAGRLTLVEAEHPYSPDTFAREVAQSSLVLTEYPPDARVLDAGPMSFTPRDFELGFGGASRTIARLVRLARTHTFRRSAERHRQVS